MLPRASFTALTGLPEITPGADLAAMICAAAQRLGTAIADGSILVVAQKIVSKSEGRFVRLAGVSPSPRARELAARTGKDERLVELILSESSAVLRACPGVLIVRHRLGHVMANAGIDRSNVPGGDDAVLLLPADPDRSAAGLRARIHALSGADAGVIVSDSFGRPWRNGVVNVAIGVAGLPSLVDRRGGHDRHGRRLEVTQIAFADAVSAAAALVMGEGAEGTPAVIADGLGTRYPDAPRCDSKALIRPLEEDLFQ